jgi:chemotaxis protein MotB
MARRKEAGHGGGHGWFVTFADLMGLLVSFFVMLVAFSTQDQAKLQVVAGSMRDAFGVQDRVRYSGIIEVLGLPTRPKLRNAAHIDPSEASATPSPEESDRQRSYGARLKEDRKFSLASASLRQALQEMPEIAEASKHIMLEETKQGLNIEIVDQDGRSMFPEGGKEPYERTRKLLQKIAPQLKAMPYRLPSLVTPHQLKWRQSLAMVPGNYRPIALMPYVKYWSRKASRQAIFLWWRARPILTYCFLTIRICRRTDA